MKQFVEPSVRTKEWLGQPNFCQEDKDEFKGPTSDSNSEYIFIRIGICATHAVGLDNRDLAKSDLRASSKTDCR